MEQIRSLYRLVVMVMFLVCLGFINVGMCSESDPLIKTYVSSNDDHLVYSTKLNEVRDIVSDSEWSELVLKSQDPVIVMFMTTWSGPCRIISPTFNKLESTYTGMKFYRLDIDDVPTIQQQYAVRSVPTFMVFKGGAKVDVSSGANSKALKDLVERNL